MIRLSITLLLIALSHCAFSQRIEARHLQCENRFNPLNIDNTQPLFGWEINPLTIEKAQPLLSGESNSAQRNCKQTAYQIIVSHKKANVQNGIGDIWNTGKIVSSQSINVKYAGKKLLPATKYYWRVRVWQQKDSTWSTTASFTTGLFTQDDWSNAKWIGYEELPDSARIVPGIHAPEVKKLLGPDKAKERTIIPLFRKTFTADKQVVSALAFISGLGHYELSINGKKVGNSFLAPGWTMYDKRSFYNVYDVTALLNKKENAVGVIVGNGFYNINRERYFKLITAFGMPKMICKIQLTYTDGSVKTIVSDNSWKTTPSPIVFTSIYAGEDYDATLEQKHWNQPLFNDNNWKSALTVKAPTGLLEAEKDYPIAIMDSFKSATITQPQPGVYVYDFGQNLSGIFELKVTGKKGQTVKLIPAELTDSAGFANQKATGRTHSYSYTLKGDGVETWSPRFTYYGFRYIQVEGGIPANKKQSDTAATIISLTSLHTRNSAPTTGTFECSNPLFNKINTLISWAIKSNMQSVITDCPHREKLSWLEQDYLMGEGIQHNFNVYHLYRKLVNDMMDAQTTEGLIPSISPEFVYFNYPGISFRDSPEWGSASVILPWLLYKWYGDTETMATAYPMMKKYIAYLQKQSNNHILSYGLGDWYDYGPKKPGVAQLTPIPVTATAIYYYDLTLLSKMATSLNKKDDADMYAQQAEEVKKAFNNHFFNASTKVYATGSQTSMAMPLCVGLVEEKDKAAVLKNLIDSINHHDKKLTAGDVGYHFLVQALKEGGASQLIYEMNNRDDVAGYGYQIKKGATSLTESWEALKEVSNNHLMLGHIMEWFYNGVLGINQAPNSIGYKDIIIKPQVVGDITYAKGSYQTMYGTIVSDWKKENGKFTLRVKIPVNTTATIYLPTTPTSKIVTVGSGEHEFVVE